MRYFSVLLSVYIKENPEYLRDSLTSVFNQSIKPAEVILVEDGPLTSELYNVINEFKAVHPELKSLPSSINEGLGKALNRGLEACSYDLVARMDTDDIAKPNRFEKQLEIFEKYPNIDVCGAWMDEFEGTIENVTHVKKMPETPEELYEYGKKRNPVNHPVTMFRKKKVQYNGNYQDYPLFEDYFLWIRMMQYGCKFYCIQESLLYFRTSPAMIKRRGGFKYALTEIRMQHLLYGLRYINYSTFLKNIFIRFSVRLMPNSLRKLIYGMIRKR